MFLHFLAALFYVKYAGRFPAELLSFFILFLPRGRKRTEQEKEDAARLKFSCVPGCSDAYGTSDLIEESCFAA